jgi:hypothetical protein
VHTRRRSDENVRPWLAGPRRLTQEPGGDVVILAGPSAAAEPDDDARRVLAIEIMVERGRRGRRWRRATRHELIITLSDIDIHVLATPTPAPTGGARAAGGTRHPGG